MILLPAIDILDGKAVRLAKGDFDAEDRVRRRPARRGAPMGRRRRPRPARGRPRRRAQRRSRPTSSTSGRIAAEVDVPVQVGGGLRTIEAVEAAIERRRHARRAGHGRLSATSTSSTTALEEFGAG